MNNDLISRKALKNTILLGNYDTRSKILSAIDNAPTVEPERQKGEWIIVNQDNEGIHEIKCPFCHYSKGSDFSSILTVTFERFPPFCEKCGAELKGGADMRKNVLEDSRNSA